MHKRFISVLVLVAFILGCGYFETSALNIADQTIYEQDFEAANEGASLETTGMRRMDAATGILDIIRDPQNSNNQCGRYIKKTAGEMFLVQYFPKTLEGTVTVKISFKTESEAYQTLAVWGENSEGAVKTIAGVSMSGYTLRAGSAAQPLSADDWNNIMIKIDTEDDVYSVYLDNKCILECEPLSIPANNLSYFRMNMQATDKAMYIDNIEISQTWKPLKSEEVSSGNSEDESEINVPVENGEIKVSDLGAYPNDGKDDGEAVRKAIRAAAKIGNGTKVVFESGIYEFSQKLPGSRYFISAQGAQDIEICGDGTTVLLKDPFSGTFDMSGTKNVVLSGFTVKYETAPWAQGTIEDVNDDGTFVYRVQEGYDIFSDERYNDFSKPFGVALEDEEKGLFLRRDMPDYFKFKSAERIDERLYLVTLDQNYVHLVTSKTLKKGDRVIYTNRSLGVGSSILGSGSENLTVKDMTIHESADCLMVAAGIRGTTTIENVKAKIDEGRWVVSNADGFHIQVSRGPLIIKNCDVEGLLDDGVNIYQYPGLMTKKTSDRAFTVKHPQQNLPEVGETIIVYDPVTYEERGRSKVIEVNKKSPLEADVKLESDILGVKTGEAVPEADTWTNADCRAPGTQIINNTFSRCRRFGLLLKSCDTLVEGNTLKTLGDDAINFTARMSAPGVEGPFAENITVRNNTIDNAAYRDSARRGSKTAKGAAITVPDSGEFTPIKNLTFEGNTFVNMPQYGIAAASVDGLFVKNNKFYAKENEDVIASEAGDVYVSKSKNVEITGNTVSDMREKVKNAIFLDNKCDNVTVENNDIKTAGGADVEFQSGIAGFDIAIPKGSPQIDGDLSDWQGGHTFTVDKAESAFLFSNYSPDDLSYKGRYLWDEDNFYLAVEATDDVHFPAAKDNSARAWEYDSIQIAFDSERIAGKGLYGYVGLMLGDNGVTRRSSTVSGIEAGDISDVKLAVKRNEENKTTVYEAAIPWKAVMPGSFNLKERGYIGVSMLMNDNDGIGRKGYLEYFSGIGNAKNPEEYATAILVNKLEDADIKVEFDDVKLHWAKKYIEQMAFLGVIQGYDNGLFLPDEKVTTAEFISMLVRRKNYKLSAYKNIISDVGSGSWFADYIQTGMDNGMIDGGFIENNKIRPNEYLTRAMAAALIAKSQNLVRTGENEYNLGKIPFWQKYYMECAIDAGIFQGYSDGGYYPENNLTRAEAAVILSKI